MSTKWNIVYLMAVIVMVFNQSATAQDTQHFSLTVEVHDLRNDNGVVQFALYNRDGSLPDQNYQRAFKIGQSTILDHNAKYDFTGIPPGTYAVNILHDENKNKMIDMGILKPKEGIGFSNFSTIGLINRPSFAKAKIEVTGDRVIEVKVIYF